MTRRPPAAPRRATQQMGSDGTTVCACGTPKPLFARTCRHCCDRGPEFKVLDALIRGGYGDTPQTDMPEIVAYAERWGTLAPVILDLCCGRGEWASGFVAEGYHVLGYDIVEQPDYPGEFRQADVRTLRGRDFMGASLVIAAPPCESFSRYQMPWTRRRNPPPPDLSVVEACRRIAREAAAPLVLEGVCAAQVWIGRAAWHAGGFYLFGDVPAIMPEVVVPHRESVSSVSRVEIVPPGVAQWIARCYRPVEREREGVA